MGLAPMFIQRIRLGPVTLKIAKRVGADLSLHFCPAFSERLRRGRRHELIATLIDHDNCDAIVR